MRVRALQAAMGGVLLVSGMLVGRVMLAHDSLAVGAGPSRDRVDSSLHKIVRSQRRLEERMEALVQALERLQQGQAASAGAASAGQAAATAAIAQSAATAGSNAAASAGAASAARDCPKRSPFHTLLTSQSSAYQQWQSRIAYFHWKKQAAADGPCTDMVAFHRLCATPGGKPDGLEREIPTLFTTQLSDEVINSHFGFGVLNRPNSVRQLLASDEMRATLAAPFVLLLETDHVFMRPLTNLATAAKPAAWVFGYMHAHEAQNGVIRKYWPAGDASKLDPVGPSPLLIHMDTLVRRPSRAGSNPRGAAAVAWRASREERGARTRAKRKQLGHWAAGGRAKPAAQKKGGSGTGLAGGPWRAMRARTGSSL